MAIRFSSVSLLESLKKEKKKNREKDLMSEVEQILKSESEHESEILSRLNGKNYKQTTNFSDLEEEHLFEISQIKALCIKYRLRFLDASLFKADLPYAALAQIKELEKRWGVPLHDFKIMAPKKMFHLSDKDSDPILFLKVSEKHYYFIHQWGGEMNRFRAILSYPLRNLHSMIFFLLSLAFLFSLLIPTSGWSVFAFLFVHTFIALCGIACLVVFGLRENFSDVEWNSKYFS